MNAGRGCQTERTRDVIVIGGGPSGLAFAIYAIRADLSVLVIEKGCLVNSIYHYPENMTFFTTAELLEIGDVPMTTTSEKPKRLDALKYYRRVAQHFDLDIRDYEQVTSIGGQDLDFTVKTLGRLGGEKQYSARKIVVATGYYDNPNLLGVPGEDLPHVSHYYTDPHPYFRKKVVVVGGKNSAAIAALELYRNGADVTLVHRGPEMGREVKYWIRPDLENRLKKSEIRAFFSSSIKEIGPDLVTLVTPQGEKTLQADAVFALTGYHPDPDLFRQAGVGFDADTFVPEHNPETLQTNRPGIYVAGSVVSGRLTNRIFIENGRFHGEQIVPHILESLKAAVS